MSNIQRDFSYLESQKEKTLQSLADVTESSLLQFIGIKVPSLTRVYFDTAIQMTDKKRQINRSWCDYNQAAQEYESIRMQLIGVPVGGGVCKQGISLSNTLHRILRMRDSLFVEHEHLLANFKDIKSRNDQARRFIDPNTIKIVDSYVHHLDMLDQLIERNADTAQDLRSKLDASKASYRGVLLRLEEISGEIRNETGVPI